MAVIDQPWAPELGQGHPSRHPPFLVVDVQGKPLRTWAPSEVSGNRLG